MLKKAGIVVAATAAGLLAVSPLAFAGEFQGESNHHNKGHHNNHHKRAACYQKNSATDRSDGHGGLINVSDVAVQVPIQACNNSVLEGVIGVLARDLRNDDSHGH